MSRPSRSREALEALRTYYREHGILPTIEVLTDLMGYRSSGSTHPVVKALVAEGFLEQEGKGGRLKPGPLFIEKTDSGPALPLFAPDNCRTALATNAHPVLGILQGDTLVYEPGSPTAVGDVLVGQRGAEITVECLSENRLPKGYLRVGRDYGNFGRNDIKVLNCNKKLNRPVGEFNSRQT